MEVVNLLEALKSNYEDEQKIKDSLESKAANLIAFVAIIVTIFVGFLSSVLKTQAAFSISHILFWIGTILYLVSGLSSLMALRVQWGNLPLKVTPNLIEKVNESSLSDQQLEKVFQHDYLVSIEDLTRINNNKANWLQLGFASAFLAVVSTVFLVAVLL